MNNSDQASGQLEEKIEGLEKKFSELLDRLGKVDQKEEGHDLNWSKKTRPPVNFHQTNNQNITQNNEQTNNNDQKLEGKARSTADPEIKNRTKGSKL